MLKALCLSGKRGLLDGGLTHLVARVLNNAISGRIFGDSIGIAAMLLNNLSETGKVTVIAARQQENLLAMLLRMESMKRKISKRWGY